MNRLSILVVGMLLAACDNSAIQSGVSRDEGLRYTGELRSFRETFITPPAIERVWQFKVLRMAPEGSLVSQGDPVVWFDPSEPRRRLQEQQSQLAQRQQSIQDKALQLDQTLQELRLNLAEAEMNRDKAQLKASINDPVMPEVERRIYQLDAQIAAEKVREIESSIEQQETSAAAEQTVDEAELVRLQARVASMSQGISQMSLTAPQDGILLYQSGFGGEKFAAGSDVYRALAVVSISDLNFIEVRVAVPERDLRAINLEEPVSLKIDSVDDRSWQGRVKSVSTVYRQQNSAVYADVVVEVVDPDPQVMRPGLKAQIRFEEIGQ
ncbi:efflux RND transporter periplasmic adaptor subunit [Umboniibacter marinipuniceus]|uniref:CusB/HlyD membrane fusion family barrel-sandwich protein n=1 Tax=Umboniibacter marinipuniceus TaxID=569599 RepID=A0A3M0A565_9GAMM|nr:efflux RND transporter periplasmic adaptor subunit [Umboniibacter marinipuniceus]RMA80183.1 CusB/HlyD membrane fusion family barrel-sandwich protein [Umboniibacter marinipuniceus]